MLYWHLFAMGLHFLLVYKLRGETRKGDLGPPILDLELKLDGKLKFQFQFQLQVLVEKWILNTISVIVGHRVGLFVFFGIFCVKFSP